jgi:hypothetical protein
MKDFAIFRIVALVLVIGLLTATAKADVLQEDEFTYFFPNEGENQGEPATWTGEVQIVEKMLDEEQTTAFYAGMSWPAPVTGQEAFIYEVSNISWEPNDGNNGLSGFNIVNVFDINTVGNAFGPAGWEAFAGYSGINTEPNPDNFEYDRRDSNGPGVLVGQTGVFGFTVAANRYIDVHYGEGHWIHSWLNDVQVDVWDLNDISGPAPFVTKELTETNDDDGDGIVEVGEETEFVLVITVVNNDASATMEDVVVKDRLGGDLELDDWDETAGALTHSTKGNSDKVFITWDVGDLAPGASETLTLYVSTDINPGTGNGKKSGQQEYTETGEHELNSGANAKGILRGVQVSATSDPITVVVFEPD